MRESRSIRSAIGGPLVADPEWLRGFRAAVAHLLVTAREVTKHFELPGYPSFDGAVQLGAAYAQLYAHLVRVGEDKERRRGDRVAVVWGCDQRIHRAFEWAARWVEDSRLKSLSLGSGEAALRDGSWLPTGPELEALGEILSLLEIGLPKPRWDRTKRELWCGEILCRSYPRDNAKNQFSLLGAFQEAGWARPIESPFHLGGDRTLRETVDDLNARLDPASPIEFHVRENRPVWDYRP